MHGQDAVTASDALPHPEYLIDKWETEAGLPENSATAMVQTSDGYLWFGTFNGLVRFDGVKFTVFDRANTPALPSAEIVNLHYDRRGQLWVSTSSGLALRTGGQWRVLGPESGWQGNYVRTFSERADGALLMTTFDGKVLEAQGERIQALPPPPGDNANGYFGGVDEEGKWWVVQNRFVGRWDGGRWVATIPESELSALERVGVGAGPARDGGLWLLLGNELRKYKRGAVAERRPLPRSNFGHWGLSEDSRGNVWVSSYMGGLFRSAPSGQVNRWTTKNGLTYNSVRFVFEDREGNLWVGTSGGGLLRFRPARFRAFGLESGLTERVVRSVAPDGQGGLWVGTWGQGVFHLEQGTMSKIPPNAYVLSVLTDRAGRTWFSTFRQGFFRIDGGRGRRVGPDPGPGPDIQAFFEDSRGGLWAAHDQGVSQVSDAGLRPVGPPGSFRTGVRCLGEDDQGALWASDFSGVYRLDGGQFVEVQDQAQRPIREVACLRADGRGGIWMGSRTDGLLHWRQGRVVVVELQAQSPVRSLHSILDDGQGFFWIASNRGVLRAKRADLEAAAAGAAARAPAQLLDLADGLPSVECPSGQQPTCARDATGRLWFATLKGVAMMDPARFRLNTNAPRVVIERIAFTDRSGARQEPAFEPGRTAVLPAGSRELGVYFAVLSYTAPEKVRIKYLLEGRGNEWVDAGSRRSLYFPTLGPEDIRLWIKAANEDGVWDERGGRLAVSVLPFYWQTAWFRVLALLAGAAGIGGGAWWAVRARVRGELSELRHQRAVREVQARLAAVLESTSDFVGFATPAHQVLYINAAGRRMLGFRPEENVAALSIRDVHPPGQAAATTREALGVAEREGLWSGENVFVARDGHEIPVSQVVIAHRNADGAIDFFSSVARDITARKASEDRIAGERNLLRTLIDHLPSSIYIKDVQGRYVMDNQAHRRLLGVLDDEPVAGRTVGDFLPADAARRFDEIDRRVMTTGQTLVNQEEPFVDPDGNRRWLLATKVPLRDDHGTIQGMVGITHDVTERRRLETELREAQKMEAIGQLAGGIAHDFNNILGAMIAYAELARVDAADNGKVQASLGEVLKAGARAADLVKQILAFSRRQKHERRSTKLQPVVQEVLRLMRSTLPATIEVVAQVRADTGAVLADPTAIHQVLVNLCTNAAYAMRDKPGRLEVTLAPFTVDDSLARLLPAAPPGEYARLTVRDTGHGMDERTLKRIFEPFFTTKPPGEGTGLGLAVLHGIVREHEGAVQVLSQPEQGATFHVYFPVHRAQAIESETPLRSLPRGRGERVLFVDDEPALCTVARLLLERLNYEVVICMKPAEALEQFRAQPDRFNLVITDLMMPGMIGVDLAVQILQIAPRMPVLLASGYTGTWTREKARELGLRDVIPKPATFEALAQAVHAALHDHEGANPRGG